MDSLAAGLPEVEMAPGVVTTRLGLGCAPILGRVSTGESRAGVAAAWAAGVRHFDTAPSYGYGRGEELLGRLLRDLGVTKQAVLVTKVGLAANPTATRVGRLGSLVRPMLRHSNALQQTVYALQRGLAPAAVPAPSIVKTIRTSLGHLGRDQVDAVLLHRLPPSDAELDDCLGQLADAQYGGLTRTFGACAADGAELARLLVRVDVPVVQAPLSAARVVTALVQDRPGLILHSVFSEGYNMESALKVSPRSVILASMYTPGHLARNVASVTDL